MKLNGLLMWLKQKLIFFHFLFLDGQDGPLPLDYNVVRNGTIKCKIKKLAVLRDYAISSYTTHAHRSVMSHKESSSLLVMKLRIFDIDQKGLCHHWHVRPKGLARNRHPEISEA